MLGETDYRGEIAGRSIEKSETGPFVLLRLSQASTDIELLSQKNGVHAGLGPPGPPAVIW